MQDKKRKLSQQPKKDFVSFQKINHMNGDNTDINILITDTNQTRQNCVSNERKNEDLKNKLKLNLHSSSIDKSITPRKFDKNDNTGNKNISKYSSKNKKKTILP